MPQPNPQRTPQPLPMASDLAAVQNRINLAFANMKNHVTRMNLLPPRPGSTSSVPPGTANTNTTTSTNTTGTAWKSRSHHAELAEDFLPRDDNTGIDYFLSASDGARQKDGKFLRDRLLGKRVKNGNLDGPTGMAGKASLTGRNNSGRGVPSRGREDSSDEDPGRSSLGKRKRTRTGEGGGSGKERKVENGDVAMGDDSREMKVGGHDENTQPTLVQEEQTLAVDGLIKEVKTARLRDANENEEGGWNGIGDDTPSVGVIYTEAGDGPRKRRKKKKTHKKHDKRRETTE